MIGQKELYSLLNELEIRFEYDEHPPVATIEEAVKYWHRAETHHCKNLFFRNHKGDRHYLVLIEHYRNVNIHFLEKKLHQGKLSFASETRLEKYLGLKPGSVSPFGLINDTEHHVHVFLDSNLETAINIAFHPNDNRVTLTLSYPDFVKYLNHTRNTFEFIDLSE
jgi:Ala-tRNA(Pro) deacylase